MTFDRTRRGFFTVMGVSVRRAAELLTAAGAEMVGSNCGNGIDAMVEVARAFRAVTEAPLAIRANAGLPESRDGVLVHPDSPGQVRRGGAGAARRRRPPRRGLLGTTPAHVRAIRAAVDAARRCAR